LKTRLFNFFFSRTFAFVLHICSSKSLTVKLPSRVKLWYFAFQFRINQKISDGLSLGVLGVGDGVTDDVLEEDLEEDPNRKKTEVSFLRD
jgi:hypothetical protein